MPALEVSFANSGDKWFACNLLHRVFCKTSFEKGEIAVAFEYNKEACEYQIVKEDKKEESKPTQQVFSNIVEIVDYSEKAIAVFGDTKAIKDKLKALGGRFNPFLMNNGEKMAGWIFSKTKSSELYQLLNAGA